MGGIVEQYLVSAAFPSTVGGTGSTIKYFSSNPPQSLWNVGVSGVNAPVQSSQLGATPSASSGNGQLSFNNVAYKLTGGRFRFYASGSCISGTTSTFTPTVQINTGTIATPSYATFMGGTASGALTASTYAIWEVWADLIYGPLAGVLGGTINYQFINTSSDTSAFNTVLTPVTGLTQSGLYASQVGFVVGATFGTSNAANSASLYQFCIVQD